MRIRPSLRLARAAMVCVLAVGLGAASNAWSQSLIQALSTTYNSNPDLLASRALLRQTDETLAQAVANWRPRVTLSLEYNKVEQDFDPDPDPADVLHPERPLHDAADGPAAVPRRQDGGRHQGSPGQHPGPTGCSRRHRAECPSGGGHLVCRPGAEHRDRRCATQQRARAHPAARRHPRTLPRRRAHDHRRVAGRSAARGRQGRPGAGRGADPDRRGGLPARDRTEAGQAGRNAPDRRTADQRGRGDLAGDGFRAARRQRPVSGSPPPATA